MDTEVLKTFLEVNRTRHFGKAARNLFITQSAVSARVRQLEETVGVPLFSRARHQIHLTAAGQKMVQHAETILNAWNRARQEIVLADEGGGGLLSLACRACAISCYEIGWGGHIGIFLRSV